MNVYINQYLRHQHFFDSNYFQLLLVLSSLQKSEFLKLIISFLHYFWCQNWDQCMFTWKIKIINFYYSNFWWPKVVRSSCYRKNALVENLLIYIYLHCVRRLSWSATYVATLASRVRKAYWYLHMVWVKYVQVFKCILLS